jgi:hypothetical protein
MFLLGFFIKSAKRIAVGIFVVGSYEGGIEVKRPYEVPYPDQTTA